MENNLYLPRFWWRIWAWLIDSLVLGLAGSVLQLIFQNQLPASGSGFKIMSGLIFLLYMTVLNSHIGNGQTLGKRAMNIQVTDIHGNTISVQKSLLRALILSLPFYINGFKIPELRGSTLILAIQIALLLAFGIGNILFYVLNKKTRQGVHDILVKTYVVELERSQETFYMPVIGKSGLYILMGIFVVTTTLYAFYRTSNPAIGELQHMENAIMAQGNIDDVTINRGSRITTDGRQVVYTIIIQSKKMLNDIGDEAANLRNSELRATAKIFLRSNIQPAKEDILTIVVNSGFDMGIYKRNKYFTCSKPIRDWEIIIGQ